jgi:hypothetical protein
MCPIVYRVSVIHDSYPKLWLCTIYFFPEVLKCSVHCTDLDKYLNIKTDVILVYCSFMMLLDIFFQLLNAELGTWFCPVHKHEPNILTNVCSLWL